MYWRDRNMLFFSHAIVAEFLATVRAIKIYLLHRITGLTIEWDKTTHDFPDQEPEVELNIPQVADHSPLKKVLWNK